MSIAVKLKYPVRYIVQKVPVMRYRDDDSRKGGQEILKYRQRRDINVIAQLVKQVYICTGKNHFQQIQSLFSPPDSFDTGAYRISGVNKNVPASGMR